MPLIPPVPIYLGLVPIVWDFCVVMLALGHCGIHTGGQKLQPCHCLFLPHSSLLCYFSLAHGSAWVGDTPNNIFSRKFFFFWHVSAPNRSAPYWDLDRALRRA